MKKTETSLEGVLILEPRIFEDERGYFFESFNEKNFQSLGLPSHYVQDNVSRSKKGVLRGLHFQDPNPQGKLVSVSVGTVWDVVVDIRPNSKTFGRHLGFELSADNRLMLFVPEGFAHAFCVLSETADFHYKCTEFYSPKDERGILWNDPDLGIDWPIKNPIVSVKDQKLMKFSDYRSNLRPL